MAVKTTVSDEEFVELLSGYDLGAFARPEGVEQGTVQTNYIIEIDKKRYVYRQYENRSEGSVMFETDILEHLVENDFPCPAPISRRDGTYVGSHHGKPYVLFSFVEGEPVKRPNRKQWQHLIETVAKLHSLTEGYTSPYERHRLNYGPVACLELASDKATQLGTDDAARKQAWHADAVAALNLPDTIPRGVCHADFDFSNVFYKGDRLSSLLDFDDANATYLLFDLVGLIEHWSYTHYDPLPDFKKAREVIREYTRHRPLTEIERYHLLDVHKLSILIDCVWFFDRGSTDNFYERTKIEALDGMGRRGYVEAMLGETNPRTN